MRGHRHSYPPVIHGLHQQTPTAVMMVAQCTVCKRIVSFHSMTMLQNWSLGHKTHCGAQMIVKHRLT